MALYDDLKEAGFNDDEINAHLSEERATLASAGFTPEEIDTDLGGGVIDGAVGINIGLGESKAKGGATGSWGSGATDEGGATGEWEKDFSGRIKDKWKTGEAAATLGQLRYRQLMGEDTAESQAAIADIKAEMPAPDRKKRSLPEQAVGAAAEMLPIQLQGLKEGVDRGLKLGMGFAGIAALAGQAGPQVATPEELITVPSAFAGGYGVGMLSGTVENIGKVEAGLAYDELLDMKDEEGRGIDPVIAKGAAASIGIINGLIETAQIKLLLKTIPGGEALLKGAINKSVKKAVTDKTLKAIALKYAKKYGTFIAGETAQEVTQESTNILASEVAKGLNNSLKGTDIPATTIKKVTDRLLATAEQSALAFSVMGLPGTVVSGGLEATEKKPSAKSEVTLRGVSKEAVSSGLAILERKFPQEPLRAPKPKPVTTKPSEVKPVVAAKPIAKPTAEIPEFKNTNEAVEFGNTATPEQLELLAKRRAKTEAEANRLIDADKLNEASAAATKAQYDREAIQAKEIIADHPEMFPGAKVAEKAEAVKKAPWKMTKSEFNKTITEKRYSEDIPKAERPTLAVKVDGKIYTDEKARLHADLMETIPDDIDISGLESGWIIDGEFQYQIPKVHKELIKKAISEGKPVPPSVLAEYPDLVPAKPAKAVEKAEAVKKPWEMSKAEFDKPYMPVSSKEPQPIISQTYYHGTDKYFDISEFKTKTKSINTTTLGDVETERHGIFIAESKEFASEYGKNILPLKIKAKNFADVEFEKQNFIESLDPMGKDRELWLLASAIRDNWGMFEGELGGRFVKFLKQKGYDSAYFDEYLPQDAIKKGKELTGETIVIFDAKNISQGDHKQVVRQAISEGKPVPPSVLAEYPDLAPAKEPEKAEAVKEPWNYLDATHPDSMYLSWDSLKRKGTFIGGENLTPQQKIEYHTLWIDRINKELKQVRGLTVTDKGIKWANKAAQKQKTDDVKNLIEQRRAHESKLKDLAPAKPQPTAPPSETKPERAGSTIEGEGLGKVGVEKAVESVLEPHGSVLSQIAHGKEKLIDTIKNVRTITTKQGKEHKLDAYIYELDDGRQRIALSAGDPTVLIDAAAIIRPVENGVVIESLHGGKIFEGLGGTLAKFIKKKYKNIIPDEKAPLSAAGRKATEKLIKKEGIAKPTPKAPKPSPVTTPAQIAAERLKAKLPPIEPTILMPNLPAVIRGEDFILKPVSPKRILKPATIIKREIASAKKATTKEKLLSGIKTAKQILDKRRAIITAIQKHFGLTDYELKTITRRDIRLMSNLEFKQFKDKIQILAETVNKKRIARQQLEAHIIEKELKVANLSKHLKLPPLNKMTVADLQALDAALEPFQKGDTFLTSRRMKALDGTELSGIKTWREARERMVEQINKLQGLNLTLNDLSKIKVSEWDRAKYDTGLAESNPFYRLLVEKYNKSVVISHAEILNDERQIYNLARKLKPKGIVGRIVPQQKNIFAYIQATDAVKKTMTMTSTELDIANTIIANLEMARDYLIQNEAMTQGLENYFTHIRRGVLEAIKEDGVIRGVKEVFKSYKLDEQNFDITDKNTGQVLSFDKWFRFAMHRTGTIKPTENVIKAYLTYMRMFRRKQALDEIVPVIDTYAQSITPLDATEDSKLLHGSMVRFVKEWLNTQKGKPIEALVTQNGKIDGAIRAGKLLTSLLDLGFNLPVSIASQLGEQISTYQALGKFKYALGKVRQNTQRGKAIIEKYRNFIGKNPWAELIEPSKELKDRVLEGIFILFRDATVRANKTFLLGSLTKEEYKSGNVSPERLAQLRINLGRYRYVEGMKSVMGATPLGNMYTQYKKWAIPHLRTTVRNLNMVRKKIMRQKPDSVEFNRSIIELYRLVEITTFAVIMFSFIRDENDKSFIGKLINKAYRESTTIIQALNPKMFMAAGRIVSFIEQLGTNLYMIIMLEKYKKSDGYKGVKKLKRQLTPYALKQFETPKGKSTGRKGRTDRKRTARTGGR